MADDRIQLNLVLNESTVQAVEGRIRNLVTRLNNQSISLNINGRNIDNIISRLNTLQQQLQTINSTPININANLTQAQQQYRLETERLRVSQQLELARQRTLQTENRAIQALAEENRTMTINRNLTADINGNIQHTHEHIRNANNATNDFATGLGRSLQYILQYRIITEILNQITEAYRELKSVDSAMVGYRKVTGASKSEVNALTKEAFSNASKYGRLASEYAESTERFAKAGYSDKSSALSELALLAENTGDIDNNLANEFLISSDAAWQLNGDIAELTKILDMFNELSNRTATDIEKLASGITVSGSVFAQAGLSAQDYAAIIGTATAKSQRSGEEMARAWRTIIMNLSQIRGTDIETGEIIDADRLAKSEKTLNSIGIQLREIVDGQSELRNPMQVLDEMAEKWDSLSSIQQSALAESISNKRQSNAFIAVIENWKDVEKAIEITANSSGSALRENEIYLDSWAAKSKQLSANWSEFISNMSNVEVIKGTLDMLSAGIDILDSPIGRMATQIVLVNTALAVTGRLWQAIRARSVVADILSMGVAERNLGTAIQLVSGHLWEQAAAWAASPAGMATIAITGITLITGAIKKHRQELEETAQKAGEAFDKVKADVEELDGLIQEYNDLQLSGEWDNTPIATKKKLQEDINKLLGDEADRIDIINGKYEETNKELYQQKLARLPEAQKAAFDNEQSKGENLWSDVTYNTKVGGWGYTKHGTDQEKQFLEKYKGIFGEATLGTGDDIFTLKFDNFQDFQHKYDEIQKMLQEMYEAGLGETALYKGLNEFISQFDTKVQEWRDAYAEVKNLDAQEDIGNILNSAELGFGGYIDNLEEYKQVVETIKNIWGGEHDSAYLDVLLRVLGEQFPQYAAESADAADGVTGSVGNMKASIEDLKSVSDGLKLLGTTFKELSENGHVSIDTLSDIKSTFSSSVDNIDDYINRLMKAKVGSQEFNDILSELTYGYINQKISTEELANADENYIATMLQEIGVANATEVAHHMIAVAKERERLETQVMSAATADEINELMNEEGATDATKQAIIELTRQKVELNATKLNLSGDIDQLMAEARAAGISAKAYAALERVKALKERVGPLTSDEQSFINEVTSGDFDFGWDDITSYGYTPKTYYTGGSSSKSSSSDKNEALEKELEAAENRYKIHQDETKYIDDLNYALNNLVKTEDERLDVTGKINEAYRDLADNRIKDLEHQIEITKELKGENADVTDQLREIQDIAHEEANRYREFARTELGYYKEGTTDRQKAEIDAMIEKTDEIQELQKSWWDVQKEIKEIRENLFNADKEAYEKSLEDIDAYIDARNFYSDWDNYGDNEIKALGREIEKVTDAYRRELISLEEYNKTVLELEQRIYEVAKQTALDDLDLSQSKLSSLQTLTQAHFDTTNSIAEAQHEINKELEASKTMYEYLDEDTRKLLFNQEDYNVLAEELGDIQKQANKLQRDYNSKILNATEETLEEITSQYEMQYETLMKSYEIAKAELEVAKKRQQLDNVLNERNVRMFINGQWQWVANTQDVINAQNELADAEYAKQQADTSLEQTESMHQLQKAQDKLTTTINNIENGLVNFDEEIGDITGGLSVISSVDVPALRSIMRESCTAIKDFAETLTSETIETPMSYSNSVDYAALMADLPKGSAAWNYLNKHRNAKIVGENLHYKPFASGSKYTPGGNMLVGEDKKNPFELFINSRGYTIPVNHPTLFANTNPGGIVFNNDQMADARKLWELTKFGKINNSGLVNKAVPQTVITNNDYSVTIKDLMVDTGSQDGQALINALRRYVANH